MRLRSWITSSLVLALVAAVGCQGRLAHNLPPSQQLMEPGPGVGGPGPGVIPPPGPMAGNMGRMMPTPDLPGVASAGPSFGGDIQQVQYCETGAGCEAGGCPSGGTTSQIAFLGEAGLQVSWDVSGQCTFDSAPLTVPGRQDFPQGQIYRLKVTGIPGHEAVSLYPTLEVAPATPRTLAYLDHAPIPVQFTAEDFDQVISGNFVTKVIYLPDPEFQELALAGVETLVSTRLNPGEDPIAKADQRGSILAILRVGSKDLQNAAGGQYEGEIVHAQYAEGEYVGEVPMDGTYPEPIDGAYSPADGGYIDGDYSAGDCAEGDGGYVGGYGGGPAPMGMPAGGVGGIGGGGVPPHMVANMHPQYGMPITGTPIGLPGPPHIPLGVPAGLQSHVMTNRTRMLFPPPTKQVRVSVKQRPGMDYPRPVTNVHIDETNRAPVGLFRGTMPGLVPNTMGRAAANLKAAASTCETGACQY